MPGREGMPATIARSPKEAQNTWVKAHDSAVAEYGEGARASRTAIAALKSKFEKSGDHWEKRAGKSPSGKEARKPHGHRKGGTAGVDADASKEYLYDVATRLDVRGRSKMTKNELVDAIEKTNRRKTTRAKS